MNYTLAGNIKPKQNYGSFEQNGSTWLYHTPAGYITLKDGIHHYFARDYQGSTRAVYRENQGATPGFGGLQNSTTYALDAPSITVSTYTLDERMSYFASGLPYRRDYDSDAPTDRLHLGKPWLDLDGISLYNNSARLHDPITATFITQDPLANNYTTISPYANTPGNPVNAMDKSGNDIVVLKNGIHMAMLIQHPNKKWGYYSMNGPESTSSNQPSGRKTFNNIGETEWDTPLDFFNSDYNRKDGNDINNNETNGHGYEHGYQIETTEAQDKAMTERFTEIASTKYTFHTNNCVNAVQETMKAGGLSNPAIDCIKNSSKLQPNPIFSVLIKKTYPNMSLLNYTTIKLFYSGTEYEKKDDEVVEKNPK